jgi:hypothetical protein
MANIVHIHKIAQIYQLNHAGTNALKTWMACEVQVVADSPEIR